MNLLEETQEVLLENNVSFDEVIWWGCKNFRLPLSKLFELLNVNYDNSFGCQKIATDLIIVGKTWWLERHEYDGSEWWEFKTMPQQPSEEKECPISGGMWDSLGSIKKPL